MPLTTHRMDLWNYVEDIQIIPSESTSHDNMAEGIFKGIA